MGTLSLYDEDFYAWTQEQAKIMQNNELERLDIQHLMEEIQIMGASELRELESRLAVLLTHLLKWTYQPNLRGRSWELTIKEQRRALVRHLKIMPSLKAKLPDIFIEAYGSALLKAEKETGLDEGTFPIKCDWTIVQVLDDKFFPR